MALNQPNVTLQRYFAGVAEYIFEAELGVVDPPLVDYLSHLLFRFLRSDAVHKVRGLNGRPVLEIGELVAEAEARISALKATAMKDVNDIAAETAAEIVSSLTGAPVSKDQAAKAIAGLKG